MRPSSRSSAEPARERRPVEGREAVVPEPADVALEEGAQVRDAVLQHRDPVDAHAEGEALPGVGIDARRAQHLRMHHAGAEDLEPVLALADPQRAALPRAADVDLRRGLGEREVRGAEAQFDRRHLEERPAELLEHPLQVRHREVAVDGEPLDLVEHRRVRLVHVHAVDAARRDHPEGRAPRLERTDLHRARMRAEHVRRAVVAVGPREEKGVVLLPRGMLGRDVERVEVVPVALDLRAFGHRKAHVGEDGGQLVHDLRDRVQRARAARPGPRRQRHVEPFLRQPRVERRVAERGLLRAERRVDLVAEPVQRGAARLPLLGRHPAQLAHPKADLALLPERRQPHPLERALVGSTRDVGEIPLPQRVRPVHPGVSLTRRRASFGRSGTQAGRPPQPASGGGGKRRAGLGDDGLEGRGLVDREVGKHLAVHLDPRQRQRVDEARIGQRGVDGTDARVDPLDPERAEVALAGLAVAGGVLLRLVHRLRRGAEVGAAGAIVALGLLDDLAVRGVRDDAGFDTGHFGSSAVVGHVFLDDLRIRVRQDHRAARVADELRRPLDHSVPLARGARLHQPGGGHAEALLGARLRLHLGHFQLLRGSGARTRHATSAGRAESRVIGRRAPSRKRNLDVGLGGGDEAFLAGRHAQDVRRARDLEGHARGQHDLVGLGREALCHRRPDRAEDRALETVHARGHHAMRAPGETEPPRRALERRQRQDRHPRALARHERGGGAGLAVDADRLDVRGLGDLAGGGDDAVGDGLTVRAARALDDLAVGRVLLDRDRDIVHRPHRLERVLARGALGREHHRVGALVDRGRDVRDLGARRHRRLDHALEHLRRHDHRLRGGAAHADEPLLDRRHVLHRQLDAEVAARHHHPVRDREDRREGLHARGLLDLRQDRGAALGERARLGDVLGALHERQRQPVDAEIAHELEVAPVLLRQRRERQHHVGHVDALAVRDRAADDDGAVREVRPAALDAQTDLAVVDEQRRSGLERLEDLAVRQRRAGRVAGRGVEVEAEGLALGEILRAIGEHPAAQFRALQVGEDGDGTAGIGLDLADRRVTLRDIGMPPVAHVEPKHVGTGLEERADRVVVVRRGPERGHDLHVAETSHAVVLCRRRSSARPRYGTHSDARQLVRRRWRR